MLIEEPRRCSWCTGDDLYQRYHDEEWGVPIFDSVALFERLALESMQAGLAWITVLKKRERMRMQFYGFNPLELAKCDESHIQTWLLDPGLIRHKGKLNALVRNAQLTVAEEDFSGLLWRFAPKASQRNRRAEQPASQTAESQAMAKLLKSKGYSFVGPTTCYAFMQSVGMVNDHAQDCWRYEACSSHRYCAGGD
tara:strand:+ start:118 stop:702 length:585 start_codon:yes stop_codon:yes gene_type:complete